MTDRLPDADWLGRADLAALITALGQDQARYVGGAVRDTLLGVEVKDVDVATPLLPGEVMARLDTAGIRHVPTGIDHGTVTAVLPEGPVEITTLRRDVSTDGRHATVAFASEWREDAARRDFTINALYADPVTREISDYFHGRDDLASRTIRFIGDPRQRIREDHLRILRYFRFYARFGSQVIDEASEDACAEFAAMLKGLSRERIGMEMMNLLGLPAPAAAIARMARLGVLEIVLPEADPDALSRLVSHEAAQSVRPDGVRRLAALLPADEALAAQVAARFRLSGTQKKRLVGAARRGNEPGDARALAYRLGRDQALDRLLIAGADTTPLDGWEIPTFPLKGGEIVARGITAGPEVARIHKVIEERWISEGFPDRERVETLVDEQLSAD